MFIVRVWDWLEVVIVYVVIGVINYVLRVWVCNFKYYLDFIVNKLNCVVGVIDICLEIVL